MSISVKTSQRHHQSIKKFLFQGRNTEGFSVGPPRPKWNKRLSRMGGGRFSNVKSTFFSSFNFETTLPIQRDQQWKPRRIPSRPRIHRFEKAKIDERRARAWLKNSNLVNQMREGSVFKSTQHCRVVRGKTQSRGTTMGEIENNEESSLPCFFVTLTS